MSTYTGLLELNDKIGRLLLAHVGWQGPSMPDEAAEQLIVAREAIRAAMRVMERTPKDAA
jgi:hypothetical protein